jgi:hypothetical protein
MRRNTKFRQEEVWRLMYDRGPVFVRDVAQELGISIRGATGILSRMRAGGWVQQIERQLADGRLRSRWILLRDFPPVEMRGVHAKHRENLAKGWNRHRTNSAGNANANQTNFAPEGAAD